MAEATCEHAREVQALRKFMQDEAKALRAMADLLENRALHFDGSMVEFARDAAHGYRVRAEDLEMRSQVPG